MRPDSLTYSYVGRGKHSPEVEACPQATPPGSLPALGGWQPSLLTSGLYLPPLAGCLVASVQSTPHLLLSGELPKGRESFSSSPVPPTCPAHARHRGRAPRRCAGGRCARMPPTSEGRRQTGSSPGSLPRREPPLCPGEGRVEWENSSLVWGRGWGSAIKPVQAIVGWNQSNSFKTLNSLL